MTRLAPAKAAQAAAVAQLPGLLTFKTVAALCSCSTKTIRRRVQAGIIQVVDFWGQPRIERDEYLRFYQSLPRRAPAGTSAPPIPPDPEPRRRRKKRR